jgi:hypothetical protein
VNRACSTHREDKKKETQLENFKGRGYVGDIGVDDIIYLQSVTSESCIPMETDLVSSISHLLPI